MYFANVPKILILFFCFVIVFASSCISGKKLKSTLDSSTFVPREKGTFYDSQGYWEYLPPGYGNQKKLPLLIFFHGVMRFGSGALPELLKVQAVGIPMLIAKKKWTSDLPFVVLAPQHSVYACPSADVLNNFINFAIDHYNVDPKRVYLTGLSCGAMGITDYFAKYGGKKVAAAVLVAGDIAPAWEAQACNLVNDTALWVFHGSKDVDVNVDRNEKPMQNFISCKLPRQEVQYTVFPDADHVKSFVITYDLSAGHDIYKWLLKQSK